MQQCNQMPNTQLDILYIDFIVPIRSTMDMQALMSFQKTIVMEKLSKSTHFFQSERVPSNCCFIMTTLKSVTPLDPREQYTRYIGIYTLLHELACNIASYCTSGHGIFMSRRRVKMQPTSEIIAICMLTSVIKCLLSIPQQRLVSSHTNYRVTHRSNVSILIKAHRGCQDTTQPQGPCNNTRTVQYRVILHGMGIRKYCCRNIDWIIISFMFTIVKSS